LIVSGGGKHDPPVLRSFSAAELSQGRGVAQPAAENTAQPAAKNTAHAGNGESRQSLVGCGRAVEGTTVRIVDPQTRRLCGDGQIGEIWVQGPGVAKGYWNRRAESQEVFQAYTADTHEGPFLRTGDLGFFDAGELFVVGRRKDLIILHGKNHYPQDIEATITQCHPSLRRDCGAAFSVDAEGGERLVLVHEVARPQKIDLDALLATIRGEIIREHEVSPQAIVLIKGGTLPKTSSGKIQRAETRERFLAGELDVVKQWQEASNPRPADVPQAPAVAKTDLVHCNGSPSRDELFRTVCHLLQQLIPEPGTRITPETRLFGDLGLASIDAVALQGMVEGHFRRRFPFDEFMAELGRRQARDAQVSEFVTFLHDGFAHPLGK
jgi:acyl carrier protein